MNSFTIHALVIDIIKRTIEPSQVDVEDGIIKNIKPSESAICTTYILPGFIDAHVHIESSLLIPTEFARMATVHGMVATVSDPHEIANVLGMEGVQYMLDNASKTNFNFFFGAPSCVPATQFETAGATLGVHEVEQLLDNLKILYLAEVMNYPGVLAGDEDMMAKINAAIKRNKQVDGHAPGLRGDDAIAYANAGITTDHECFTLAEAKDKIAAGMKIQIREGSAAKNFEALHSLLGTHPGKVMLCSDDKHPDNLQLGHINLLVKRALKKGHDMFDVLRAASYNTKAHYKLPVGMLQVGDSADFIEIDNLEKFNVLRTWINGELVAENGKSYLKSYQAEIINKFESRVIEETDLQIRHEGKTNIQVIEVRDGQLITKKVVVEAKLDGGLIDTNIEKDILKICVVNRYENKPPAIAFIKNIGIKKGAFASTVAHDSHNIVAVGCDDKSLCRAINLLMENKGGLSATDGENDKILPLPIAGLMTNEDAYETTEKYIFLDQFVKNELGSPLKAPFMSLSFMALLVIPKLKLSDKGLFDGNTFQFTSVTV